MWSPDVEKSVAVLTELWISGGVRFVCVWTPVWLRRCRTVCVVYRRIQAAAASMDSQSRSGHKLVAQNNIVKRRLTQSQTSAVCPCSMQQEPR